MANILAVEEASPQWRRGSTVRSINVGFDDARTWDGGSVSDTKTSTKTRVTP